MVCPLQLQKYHANEGYLVTLLNLWKVYRASNKSGGWCQEQFLISRHLQFAVEVRKQLAELCHTVTTAVSGTCHVTTRPFDKQAFKPGLST